MALDYFNSISLVFKCFQTQKQSLLNLSLETINFLLYSILKAVTICKYYLNTGKFKPF